jgi:hypothetical protein
MAEIGHADRATVDLAHEAAFDAASRGMKGMGQVGWRSCDELRHRVSGKWVQSCA